MSAGKRDLSIDVFRALAIILITGYHVLHLIDNPSKVIYIWNLYGPFQKGSVGVPLFIFISGYLIHTPAARSSFIGFMRKKFFRLAIPYYIALAVWNILLSTGLIRGGGSHDWTDNIAHLLFIHNLFPGTFYSISGVFWYLGLQMQLYLVYFPLRGFIGRHGLLIMGLSILVYLLINLIVPFFISLDSLWISVVRESVFSYAVLFLSGVLIKEHINKVKPYLQRPPILYALLVLSLAWLFSNGHLTKFQELEEMIMGFVLGLIMIGLPEFKGQNLVGRSLILIGVASYSIYLYDYIFWVFRPSFWGFKGLILYTVITICCGIAAYFLIEAPFIRSKFFARQAGK